MKTQCSKMLLPCSAVEADIRLLHCKNFNAIVLKMSDTHEVFIAVHFQHEIVIPLININTQATQKRCKFIDIQAICRKLGVEVWKMVCSHSQDVIQPAVFVGKGRRPFLT